MINAQSQNFKPFVLLVADRVENFVEFEAALHGIECEIVKVESGEQAVAFLSQNEAAVIILDVEIAGMDGFAVAEQIRSLDQNGQAPIVFVTELDGDDFNVNRAYELGAVDYFFKSVQPKVLAGKIKFLVDLYLKTKNTNQHHVSLRDTAEQEKAFLLENSLDAVIGADQTEKIIYWNKHAEFIFGWERSEAIGQKMAELIIPERFREQHRRGLRHFIRTGETKIQNRRIEVPALRRNGEEFPAELTVTSLKSASGYRFYSFIRDISERILAQEAIKESEERFRAAANTAPVLIWISGTDKLCNWFNRGWLEWTGRSMAQEMGSGWAKGVHPDDYDRYMKIFSENFDQRKEFYLEYRLKHRSGEYRWINARGVPRYNAAGAFEGYIGGCMDIHDQISKDAELRELQKRFERSAAATDLGVWYCDLPFDELIWNSEIKEHFFLPTETKVTIDMFYECMHPEDRERTTKAIEASIEHRAPYDTYFRTVNRANKSQRKWIRAIGWTDYNSAGKAIRFDGITLDVTAQFLREEELKTAKDQAERANELKSTFLANMSHEIRTPLGAMIGFADLLRDPGISRSEQSNYVDILRRNGEQLSFIINDILDLSKVEAGHLTLEYVPTRPDNIGADVVSLLRVKAKEKDLAFDYISEESTPHEVVSDPVRVRQVLLNLVSNAIKFTQFGSVKVRSYGSTNAHGRVITSFEITDTGIGVPEGQKERIFEMFVQGDGSMTRRFGGTGLGLALSRKLARELGGDVSIQTSSSHEGSKFIFSFEDRPERRDSQLGEPRPVRRKAQDFNQNEKRLKGVRILVVDDSPDNRQLIWHYLTRQGALVEAAENGLEGYKKALLGSYDIVLMDIQMPLMDGYTATQKLREHGFKKPIIALTAHALSEVRKKCLNVGCNDHLTKPLNHQELVASIERYSQGTTLM